MNMPPLPSSRWRSLDGWDYNGMAERINTLLTKIDKSILLQQAEHIVGQKLVMSEPFSAGQYWVCLEMVAVNGDIVIARLRLPRHPDSMPNLQDDDELYSTVCEVATMKFVHEKFPAVKLPRVYAYEVPGSPLASAVGAAYMLLEGFYGNTLQDSVDDICQLQASDLDHVMSQWTEMQVDLATFGSSRIGSICDLSPSGEPLLGKLSFAAAEGLPRSGPFTTTSDYFLTLAEGKLSRATETRDRSTEFAVLGCNIFIDIIRNTALFNDNAGPSFHLNHMDLGPQNILVDKDLNFLALIDWEFAHTAPWQVNHYPMPLPLLCSDEEIQSILRDPQHLAYPAISRQNSARHLYAQKFGEAERRLNEASRSLGGSFAEVLDSPASRVYAHFTRLGISSDQDEEHVREMLRLGFGFDSQGIDQYLSTTHSRGQ